MMYYVNGLLCYSEQARDQLAMFYFTKGEPVEIRPVDQDERGGYILSINDPMEQ